MSGLEGISWKSRVSLEDGRGAAVAAQNSSRRFNLLSIPWLRALLVSRWPLFVVRAVTLAGFVFTILVGLLGTRVGSHNFAIIFVWIAWWTALKLAFIPLGGRSWCSVCPLPLPGEWLRQGGIFEKSERRLGLNLRVPKRLKGSWLQSGGFLLVGLFSAVTLTEARVTAWVLLALFGLALLMSLIFERRAFCSQLCPIGGFTGMYAKTAPVELRVVDSSVCAAHDQKTCYHNCPWGAYPLALRDNAQCGLCMECLRSCPEDNIAVNLRPFGEDISKQVRSSRLDEAFLALVMIGSALAFTAVFSGPWGGLKSAAFAIGSSDWLQYSLGFLGLNLILLPGIFSLAVWMGQKWSGEKARLRWAMANQAQALLPLGLFAWIAFTVSFAFPKSHYVVSVVSDPFGWGWNLLGTANSSWSLDGGGLSALLQAAALLVGLTWSVKTASRLVNARDSKANFRQTLPVGVFCLLFTLGMLWLLVG
ncbi:MAG: 4Fe-4S binding protein [Anaerolineales bacterium]|nr:4Fe-4S binding protein [Anaerolineales bacterium]